MRPSETLDKHRAAARRIVSRYPVANPQVFGSVARGEDKEGSDLDILVEHSGELSLMQLVKLEMELERLLEVPVSVHTVAEFKKTSLAQIKSQQRAL